MFKMPTVLIKTSSRKKSTTFSCRKAKKGTCKPQATTMPMDRATSTTATTRIPTAIPIRTAAVPIPQAQATINMSITIVTITAAAAATHI
jgi:hypothetical protein